MKVYIIAFAPAQIPCRGNVWFLNCEIAALFNQLYMKKKLMNLLDLWHVDKDLRNVKDGLLIFIWT